MTKIALLSDIHIGRFGRGQEFSVEGETNQDLVDGASSLIEGLIKILKKELVEYLFVTGDITSTGSPMEYSKFNDILDRILSEAGISQENVILSLGNHDVDRRIAEISKTSYAHISCQAALDTIAKHYQQIAATTSNLFLYQNIFDIQGPAPYSGILLRDQMIVFILNSGWECSKHTNSPEGVLAKPQLDWLDKEARKYANSDKWKIILLHHHPYKYPYPTTSSDPSILKESGELLEIAGKCGFHLICHGHRHHPRAHSTLESTWTNQMIFICAGSFSVNASHRSSGDIPNCFHILELIEDNSKILFLKNFQYKIKEGWQKLEKSCAETPLDPEMYFSQPFTISQRRNAFEKILNLSENQKNIKLPKWNELPLELKTLRLEELNKLVSEMTPSNKEMFGEYPKDVALLGD
jgi:predicted phosphodiesterase